LLLLGFACVALVNCIKSCEHKSSTKRNVHYPPLAGAGCSKRIKLQVEVDKSGIELQSEQVSNLRGEAANWKQQV